MSIFKCPKCLNKLHYFHACYIDIKILGLNILKWKTVIYVNEQKNKEQYVQYDYPQGKRGESGGWGSHQFLTFLLLEILKNKPKLYQYFQNPDSQTFPQICRITISREWGPEICSS